MEQRISSVDERLIQNSAILPNNPQTSVPSPHVVKIFNNGDKENVLLVMIGKDRLLR